MDEWHSGPPDTVLPWLEQQHQHVSTPHRGKGRGEGRGRGRGEEEEMGEKEMGEKGDSGVREKVHVVFSSL